MKQKRKTLALPGRKQIDQLAVLEPFAVPADDLCDTSPGNAFLQHLFGICEPQEAAGNRDNLLIADELPIERPACIRIKELPTAMLGLGGFFRRRY